MARLMAVHFALGVFIGSEQHIRMISGTPVRWLAASVTAGLMVSSLAGWTELPYRHAILPACMFAVSGIIAVVALALLTDKAKLGAIRFLGRYSLEIYLVHTIATAGVRVALIKFAHLSAPAPHLVLGTLAGLYIPIAVALLFEQVGFSRRGLSQHKRFGKILLATGRARPFHGRHLHRTLVVLDQVRRGASECLQRWSRGQGRHRFLEG